MKVISHDTKEQKVYEAEREGCFIVLRAAGEYSLMPVDAFNRKLANESYEVVKEED